MSPTRFAGESPLAFVVATTHFAARSSTTEPKPHVPKGQIIGVAVACVSVTLVVFIAVVLLLRYRRRRRDISPSGPSNTFTPTLSGPTEEIKNSAADRVSLSSAQYIYPSNHKQNPSTSSSSTDVSALPPVALPIPPAPAVQRPPGETDGSFQPSVGGFNVPASTTTDARHGRNPSEQSNASGWSAASAGQRYIVPGDPVPSEVAQAAYYTSRRAMDAGPVPAAMLGGVAGASDWTRQGQALVKDLKQRPLPEPPKQSVPAGAAAWV